MTLTPPIQKLTQQDFLDLLERVLPDHYLRSIRDVGPGYELLQAYAKVFEKLSEAAYNLGVDAFIDLAGTGSKAAGEVELYRTNPNTVDSPISGQSGSTASIVAGAAVGQMRVSGLTNMTVASVGRFLQLSGTASAANAGSFEIAAFVDAATVDATNAAAVVPDGNNGAIAWQEATRTVTVKAGTVVSASLGGQRYRTLEDVTFQPSDVGPFTVDVEAESVGYEWNIRGQSTAADGTVLEGEIDTIDVLVEEPPLGDITIQVRQLLPTSGGTDSALAALGRNRGILQGFGEDDESYRIRIRGLPDTVSIRSFERTVADLLQPYGIGFTIIETHNVAYQTAYDAPNSAIAGSVYDPDLFCYDDPDADNDPFRNRWLGENDYRGGVIVVIDPIQPLRDVGMVYDDTAPDVSSLVSSVTGGSRAVPAYDVPNSFTVGLQGSYDGEDYEKNGLVRGLYETLQGSKPAASSVALELLGE